MHDVVLYNGFSVLVPVCIRAGILLPVGFRGLFLIDRVGQRLILPESGVERQGCGMLAFVVL